MRTVTRLLGRLLTRARRGSPTPGAIFDYRTQYDQQAKHNGENEVIGDGPYDLIGQLELELLRREGLQPHHTLVDFGCGNGRLARHAIPYLHGGTYLGVDICQEFLRRAQQQFRATVPVPECQVRWIHQTTSEFSIPDLSVDMICAFSVFTHIEHEDSFRYLRTAHRIVRPGGRFIFSCLPLDQELSRRVLTAEANEDLTTRWRRVRNVTTSKELMTWLARMAGWIPLGWYDGDQAIIAGRDGTKHAFGQSCCILAKPPI